MGTSPTNRQPGATSEQKIACWALVALVFFVCIGFQPIQRSGATALSGEGDIWRQLSYLVVLGMTAYAARGRSWLRILPLSVICVLVWCWLSVAWAIDPGIALRRMSLTTIMIAVTFATVEVAGTRRALTALITGLIVVLLLNYVAIAISPDAVHLPDANDPELGGSWRGYAIHKNTAAPICAITALIMIFCASHISRIITWPVILGALFFLWKCNSATSIALFGLAVLVGAVFLVLPAAGRRRAVLLGILFALLGAYFVPAIFPEQTNALGAYLSSPEALTGRGAIWSALLTYAQQNPILGAGYGSFWDIGPNSPIETMVASWVAELYTGHNGYLDLLVQVGIPGLALTIIAMIVVPVARLINAPSAPGRQSAFLIGTLVFCVGHNATESTLLVRDLPVSVFFLFAVALITKLAREQDCLSPAKIQSGQPVKQISAIV